MGQVINIGVAGRVASDDPILVFIDECYDRLAKLPGFVAREGQRNLSKEVCRAILAETPLVAEAPTGTGKTLAYLVGALAAAERMRTTKEVPVVIATATVGLQNQIMAGDLPRLIDAGIVSERSVSLAKGRSRYFCMAQADRIVAESKSTGQYDIFDADQNEEADTNAEVEEMLATWHAGAWVGDIDSYPGAPPSAWKTVAASAETCLRNKCEYYSVCPFFRARTALASSTVIVANHDLVLADLQMDRDGIDPLMPGGRYIAVFDEAHHLPDKAMDIGTAEIRLDEALAELPKLGGFARQLGRQADLMRHLSRNRVELADLEPALALNHLEALAAEVHALEVEPDTKQLRFPMGALTPGIRKAAEASKDDLAVIAQCLQTTMSCLKNCGNLPDRVPALKTLVPELLYQGAFLTAQVNKLNRALTLFTGPQRGVRWVFKSDTTVSLHVCPLEGADVLRDLLWGNPRAMPVMVSATLQDFAGFDRFKSRIGAPEDTRAFALPHIFPYHENTLYLVDMTYSARQDEKFKFREELKRLMPRFIDPAEATLILFPSRVLMNEVTAVLKTRFPGTLLVQGEKGIKELISDHHAKVRAGRGSVLCGLATMAEGLDLPGELCTHVIICNIPFTVPTSPLERELQELLGKDYFGQRALPDALVKLIQMVGRLMRRESDRGRITVFDNRLIRTRWGSRLVQALPGFKRQTVYRPERFVIPPRGVPVSHSAPSSTTTAALVGDGPSVADK